jgi:hypothetical protein
MTDRYKAMYAMFLTYGGQVCQSRLDLETQETSYSVVGRSVHSDMSLRFWFYPNGVSSFACEERFRGTSFTPIYEIGSNGPVEYIRGI